MTRKHYSIIAQALAEARPLRSSEREYVQWVRCVECMKDILYEDNVRFVGMKFDEATLEGEADE